MRRGMNVRALQVQEALGRDPLAGDLFDFRDARGDLIKILWRDGLGLSLNAKELDRGRFGWPTASSADAGGHPMRHQHATIAISAVQPACILDGSTSLTRFTHSGRTAQHSVCIR
jgi:transposase